MKNVNEIRINQIFATEVKRDGLQDVAVTYYTVSKLFEDFVGNTMSSNGLQITYVMSKREDLHRPHFLISSFTKSVLLIK